MDPALEIIEFISVIATQKRHDNSFDVYRGGDRVRSVWSEKGFNQVRWVFGERGDPEPWEDPAYYRQRYPGKRLNRRILLEYAGRLGLDIERCLFARDLRDPVLIEDGTIRDATDLRERTREFETQYSKALALGIGGPPAQQPDDARARHARIAAYNQLLKRLNGALKRAKSVEKVAEIAQRFAVELREIEPEEDTFLVEAWAATTAQRIDPQHPISRQLQDAYARSQKAREASARRHIASVTDPAVPTPSAKEATEMLLRNFAATEPIPAMEDALSDLTIEPISLFRPSDIKVKEDGRVEVFGVDLAINEDGSIEQIKPEDIDFKPDGTITIKGRVFRRETD